MKRFAALITLAFLSPLIAEYLSGSMSLTLIAAMPVMLAMYGGGVILIRELVRRTGRGWPSILFLGLAYALVEEGIADQSLFNPNFMGLHQLASGYIPALGIGVSATIFAFGIHVIWSIAVPIALAESLFPSIRNQPWTGRIGLAVAALFYVAGVALITQYFAKKFVASPAQLAASMTGVAVLTVIGFMLPRVRPKSPGPAPSPWVAGIVALITTSAFTQFYGFSLRHGPWQVAAGGMALALVLLLGFAYGAARRSGWTPMHTYALAAGALLTTCWAGFFTSLALHGPATLPAHTVLAATIIALLVLAGINVRSAR